MTDASSADRPTDARARLLSHFGSTASKDQGVKWDELWCEGSFLPWDKGSPNPALRDLLANSLPSHCVPSEATPLLPDPVDGETGRRRRALVPGCGKGYDVQLLAAAGYEAWGLEISPAAVEAAKQWSKEAESRGFKDGYETMSEKWGRGTANFVCGDFFKDDWLQQIGVKGPGVFDIIYDYTFLSALPPDLRPKWALQMSRLLSQDSRAALVCVEFPTYKPPTTGGPPFGLPSKVYEQHLSRPGEELRYQEDGHIFEEKQQRGSLEYVPMNGEGLIRVVHYAPPNTHEIGKGTDMVSVWRHPTKEEYDARQAV
ncbi:S-adenosyl-L-methionine-dependent methyltransferase [Phyllosticta capitalensis]|uniref:S-adenosyl-L-methionine-dependent methyltransferase n=1 Tax=Phyllosticta capitalensis TaxID=121624 RepID=UPI00312D0DE0